MTSIDTTAALVGERSSVAAGLCTLLFALQMALADSPYISYAACIILSIAFLLTCLANAHIVKNSGKAAAWKQVFADAASLLAVVYCTCESIVYYVQLTFVRLGNLSPEILSVVQYTPPSAFFAINILGYSFLALSTLFMGFSLKGDDGPLSSMLIFHGIWGLSGLIAPALPFFYDDDSKSEEDSDYWMSMMALEVWCLIFGSNCILLVRHFRRLGAGYESSRKIK